MGLPAARANDIHVCPALTGIVPHVGGPTLVGYPQVLIGGFPALRQGDMAVCIGPPASVIKGSPTVFVGSMPLARMTDSTAHGGVIALGCPLVLIG